MTAPADIQPEASVTDACLARLAGVSARRIRQLAENGTLERIERGRYALGPSVQALIEDAAGTGSALQRERTRKVKADADRAELAYAQECKLVAPIEDFEREQARVAALIRARMRQIPQRLALRLLGETDETKLKTTLLAEIDQALNDCYQEITSHGAEQTQP